MSLSDAEQAALLADPVTLPCGLRLPNRLVKAAMEELLGTLQGEVTQDMLLLYYRWGTGGWGLIITGNVQVSPSHLGFPVDITVPFPSSPSYASSLALFSRWSAVSHGPTMPHDHTPVILQLCHTGRQSMRCMGRGPFRRSKAPSAVGVVPTTGLLGRLLGEVVWGTPSAMTEEEIGEVVQGFVQGARVARETGFDGVQLHASHGYLLAQFLSPNVNLRNDNWGGTPRERMALLLEIIRAIRRAFHLESGFCVGVKLNSSDYVKGGLTEEDALDNVRWLAEEGGVDFIEISGGTYENPSFLNDTVPPTPSYAEQQQQPLKPSTVAREAFFHSFASRARSMLATLPPTSLPDHGKVPLILLTGGFRTRPAMAAALTSTGDQAQASDLIGLARPAAAAPGLPRTLLDPKVASTLARAPEYQVTTPWWFACLPLIGGLPLFLPGVSSLFHMLLMAQVGRGQRPTFEKGFGELMWVVWGMAVVKWVGRWARRWSELLLGLLLMVMWVLLLRGGYV